MTSTSLLVANPFADLTTDTAPFYEQARHCLDQAYNLLDTHETKWVRGAEAIDDDLRSVPAYDWNAIAWSAEGAVKFEDGAYVDFFRQHLDQEPTTPFPSDLALDILRWTLLAYTHLNHGQYFSVEAFNDHFGRTAVLLLLDTACSEVGGRLEELEEAS